jgi:hypothetical protein
MGTADARAMNRPPTGRTSGDAPLRGRGAKAAELVSGLGAIVLGAGLALVLPFWLRAFALPLLVAGVLVHGAGMTLRYRLDGRVGPPRWWERASFWLCWACLAALSLWLAVAFATAR